MTRGRKLRVDTTVVETNIHYPTDSGLLSDSVRVLTRIIEKAKYAGRIMNIGFNHGGLDPKFATTCHLTRFGKASVISLSS